jgi:hypothetical protein
MLAVLSAAIGCVMSSVTQWLVGSTSWLCLAGTIRIGWWDLIRSCLPAAASQSSTCTGEVHGFAVVCSFGMQSREQAMLVLLAHKEVQAERVHVGACGSHNACLGADLETCLLWLGWVVKSVLLSGLYCGCWTLIHVPPAICIANKTFWRVDSCSSACIPCHVCSLQPVLECHNPGQHKTVHPTLQQVGVAKSCSSACCACHVCSLYWSVTTLAGNEWNGMDSVHDMRQVVANTFRARCGLYCCCQCCSTPGDR